MLQKIKKNRAFLILGVLMLVLIGGVIYKIQTKPKGKEVTVEESSLRTIKETVTASGKVFPETEVKISSDVSGEIVELYVKEGDSVVVGQILAKINPDAYESAVQRGEASVNASKSQVAISKAQIESAKSQKEQIGAQLENARTIHKRNEQLKKDGVISQAEFDQSLSSLRSLEANFRAAEASIRSAEKNYEAAAYSTKGSQAALAELKTSLDRTIIRAPQSGIISSLSVEKGERVVGTIQMTGTEMMRISNLNAMEVQVNVSENDILKVNIGDDADIEVDAYLGKKFRGVVTQIANSASNIRSTSTGQLSLTTDQVTNFVVKIRIFEDSYSALKSETNKYVLRPGMSASVDIYTEEAKNVLSVPIQSVTIREKKTTEKVVRDTTQQRSMEDFDQVVFVMEEDTVKMVVVETGIQDNDYIHVIKGLQKGQKVVSGPYALLSKGLEGGDSVRIKKDDDDEEQK